MSTYPVIESPRDPCWNAARDGHTDPTCPVAREQRRIDDGLLGWLNLRGGSSSETRSVPERGEWDAPVGGWEPRT